MCMYATRCRQAILQLVYIIPITYTYIYRERERERDQCINESVCTGEVYTLRGYKTIPYAMAFEWWAYQPKYPRLVVNMLFQKAG